MWLRNYLIRVWLNDKVTLLACAPFATHMFDALALFHLLLTEALDQQCLSIRQLYLEIMLKIQIQLASYLSIILNTQALSSTLTSLMCYSLEPQVYKFVHSIMYGYNHYTVPHKGNIALPCHYFACLLNAQYSKLDSCSQLLTK